MATATLVITYTPAAGSGASDAGEIVTSMTVDGTAYGSLTEALVTKALRIMDLGYKQLAADKCGITLTGQVAGTSISKNNGIPKQTT